LKRNWILIALIAVGLCASAVSFKNRWSAEWKNRAVELVIDWPDAQALANTRTRAMDDVLGRLRTAGITTVAVTEETLETLHGNGIVNYARSGNNTLITFAPGFATQEQRVIDAMNHKTKIHITPVVGTAGRLPPGTTGSADQFMVDAPWPQFNGTPIGLDDDIVKTVRRNGLLVAPRLLNYTGVTRDSIYWELEQVKAQCGPHGIGPLIFSGAAVLGYRGRIDATAHALKDLGLTYGSVEFAKTFGDDDLSRFGAASTVRVHSIGVDEMGNMEEPTAIERFVRGAKERNIRVCYVRLFTNGLAQEPDATEANTKFVEKIVAGMKQAQLTVEGPAHPYRTDPKPGLVLRILMAIGVAAGAVWLFLAFFGFENRAFSPLLIGSILVFAGLAALPGAKSREVLALIAACVYPTLALCARPIRPTTDARSGGSAVVSALLEYVRISLVTFAGIFFVVGLLSGRLFLLKIDEFLGVKLVLAAPILLVAAFYGLGLAELDTHAQWPTRRRRIAERLGGLTALPLRLGPVFVGLIGLAGFIFLVARSGNDPGVGVSSTELHMRALLDKYLGVRPRTKEFLFGHPALLAGVALAMSTRLPLGATALSGLRARWVPWLVVFGAVGQSSLMDTFCHLHTPLIWSLLRAWIGLGLGAIIGVIVFRIIQRLTPEASADRGSTSPGEPDGPGANEPKRLEAVQA
jgi:hypothetical protein